MPLSNEEAGLACSLSRLSCLGPVRLGRLRRRFGTFAAALSASPEAVAACDIPAEDAAKLVRSAKDVRERAKQDADWLVREDIRTLAPEDEDFPRLLRELPDAPAYLHCRGRTVADAAAVAVVGTRAATQYGMQMAAEIAGGLASAGVVVVSGLALGIDAAAHRACLEAGGTTWGFLGSGLNAASVYPPSNRVLAKEMTAAGGALLSEFAPGLAGFKHVFAVRNRLIAGCSLATVVIEAAEKSGSLITAHAATEYDREVMAVPADARRPSAAGPHALLRKGATLVTSADDVLDSLGLTKQVRETPKTLPDGLGAVLARLTREPVRVDDLAAMTACSVQDLAVSLSRLEVMGRCRRVGDGWTRSG